jgi:predicted transglutaminase-like cysteine proteinase
MALALAFGGGSATAETPRVQTIGRPVAAPAGFLDFCRRTPSECRAAGQSALDDGHIRREASSLYWSNGFGGDSEAAVRSWRARAARQTATQAELDYQAINETIADDGLRNAIPAATAGDPAQEAEPIRPVITPAPVQRLPLNADGWSRVDRINQSANTRLRYESDQAQYARADYWTDAPASGAARGDCEDYVLTKRRELIAAGVPVETLSVAIVETPRGEVHAVLIVARQDGDYVMDNLTPRILRWDQTGYRWKSRQAPGAVFDWVQVGEDSRAG